MKVAVISLTENGRNLSEKISRIDEGNIIYTRYALSKHSGGDTIPFDSLSGLVAEIFEKYDGIVFICSCGIAVRMIAPHIVSKLSDPAVAAVDENGKFAVSLLSGHIGGANALTEKIACNIGCVPVITTATDTGGKFSPDSFAVSNQLYICEPEKAKLIAARIVEGGRIGFSCGYKYINKPDMFFDDSCLDMGICVCENVNLMPFQTTLHLIPRNIIIGVGCRKNADKDTFEKFVLNKLDEFGIPLYRVCAVHSVDLKKDEEAVTAFCEKYKIPFKCYSSEELMNAEGEFTSSEFVRSITGADNVCERSAAMGGKMIVPKQTGSSATFAAAEAEVTIDFERKIL